MTQDSEFQKQVRRIGEMVEHLETAADPNTCALAKELVESLMALHGAGLEKMLELASASGSEGEALIRNYGHDKLVSSLLLLYGLHPEDLRSRVSRAMENSRSYLERNSASADLLSISGEGVVTVRLNVKATGCGSNSAAVKATLEGSLQDAAPDAASIVIEEEGAGLAGAGFVSVAQLQAGHGMAALSIARMQRSGD